jgi:hypothetical protein
MWIRGAAAVLLLWQRAVSAGVPWPPADTAVEVTVVDSANLPIPGVRLELNIGPLVVASAESDAEGHAVFSGLKAAHYSLKASKDGLQTTERGDIVVAAGSSVAVELKMGAMQHHESVDVVESIAPIEQGATVPTRLPPKAAKELPSRPATVAEALPLVPGVLRKPDGSLQISGSAEHRSSLIVNSADVTDPATGQFGLTVPIDSVETVNVFQTPYMAEYGRFSAGLVSVETRRGGEKWKWELNDPFPDFYIRSWKLRGLRDATPRLNLEGPLIAGKLYFSEGLEYEYRKTEIYTLPWNDQKKKQGVNSFAQIDWVASETQLVTGTVHVAPQRLDNVNLDYFNPVPTTPNAGTQNYTATLSDHLTLGGGLLENTISGTRFDANVWGHGDSDLVITPEGNAGNYFAQQSRQASRIGWLPSYAFRQLKKWGTHDFKVGSYIAYSAVHGQINDHTVDILNADYQLTEQITYSNSHTPYSLSDTEYAFYGQDHWTLSKRVAIDLGVRTESQEVSESFRLAPRFGVAWTPLAHHATVIRAGFGLFYEHVPLNVYTFNHYPRQYQTFYGPDGQIVAGPYFYGNALSEVNVRTPFVFRNQGPGNFSPRSTIGSIALEQPVGTLLQLRVSFIENHGDGLVIMDRIAPDPTNNVGAFELTGAGGSEYRQVEATARVRLTGKRQLFFSYVHSHARGDLNDFNGFLGSFATPIIRQNQFGTLGSDIPNRFLTWGLLQLPQGFQIAPVVEYRTGFPYSALDASQNYYGVPNGYRYPGFFSFDSRFSKDVKITAKYTVRFSVSGYNMSNHFNPEAVHYNVADPAYGILFGQRQRRFTADFDVLF